MRKTRRTIRDLRKLKGWTQVELARHTGVAPSTIYNWEAGRFEPRVSQLRDLADALGVTMDEIEMVDEGKLAAA
jgi:transcriptional regulator with XRE-family HTH domain